MWSECSSARTGLPPQGSSRSRGQIVRVGMEEKVRTEGAEKVPGPRDKSRGKDHGPGRVDRYSVNPKH